MWLLKGFKSLSSLQVNSLLPCLSQARDMPPQDKTDFRPVLVAVGLLLAPDDFQMVLDADDTSKSTEFSFLLSLFTKPN